MPHEIETTQRSKEFCEDPRLNSLADLADVAKKVVDDFPPNDGRKRLLISGVWEHTLENNLPKLVGKLKEKQLENSGFNAELVGYINGLVQILRPEFIAAINAREKADGELTVAQAQAFLTEISEFLGGVK